MGNLPQRYLEVYLAVTRYADLSCKTGLPDVPLLVL